MIKPGTLLIAPPAVQHNLWGGSTVLITDIERTNAVGLITNKPSRMSISEFGDRLGYDLDHISGMLYIGGPERQTSFTILHSSEWKCSNTFKISNEFSITSNDDALKRFYLGDEPEQWRMFLGMCVWPIEKLEKQISGDITGTTHINWCTSSSDSELIFDTDVEDVWDNALERCSLEFAQNFML
jgi:putative transcriptional regulator